MTSTPMGVYPVISLRLAPHFDSAGVATHLSAKYTIQQPDAKANQSFLLYEIWRGNVPAHPYTEADVRALDDDGLLSLDFVPVPGKEKREQRWEATRDTIGDVKIEVDVFPRQVDRTTPLGSRADLRTDRGGLQGGGRWFLPRLVIKEDSATYTNIVEWDLAKAPEGTRAIWSHGEGPAPISRNGPADTVTNAIYMVGPVRSYPSDARPGNEAGFCGTYWFGELPSNLDRLKDFNPTLYKPMTAWFNMTDGSYRVFIRNVASGYGGSGFRDSYVMEYDHRTHAEEDIEVQWLWAHEMVHSFALMDFESDGNLNAWYSEGLAEYYGVFLPYRFGILPSSYVGRLINGKLSGYGTNPQMNISEKEAYTSFFDNWYSEKISYNRGLAYFLLLDSRLRKALRVTDPKAPTPLDDAVIDLAQRRRRDGVKILQQDFLEHLGRCFEGKFDYAQELRDMVNGKTIDLAGQFVASPNNTLTQTTYGVQQIGWNRGREISPDGYDLVLEVVLGSNAAEVGLKAGDVILSNTRGGWVQENPVQKFSLETIRDGKKVQLEWLPRENKQEPCWELKAFDGETVPAFVSRRARPI